LRSKFIFNIPLGSEWIDEKLLQTNQNTMPTELKTAEQELNINSEQLNKNHPDFKTTIKKIKNNYTGKIPRDWITPMLPDLPSISETQKYLTNNNISINMPILEDQISQPISKLSENTSSLKDFHLNSSQNQNHLNQY
jgi:hypothetical protein